MKKSAIFLLTFVVVATVSLPLGALTRPTPVAHAEAVTVVGGVGSVAEKVIAAASLLISEATAALTFKEYVLDNIAFLAAQRILQQMVRSTISWINSGFQGSPAFVTDLQGYLLNIADETAGELIYGSELGFLCRPVNVRIALAIQYQQQNDLKRQVQCTLSGVVGNVEGFLNGNFADGGWPGWFELFLNPQNNVVGGTAIAQVYIENEILKRKALASKKLDWGQGLLSWEECPSGSDSGGTAAIAGARDVAATATGIPSTSNTNLNVGQPIADPNAAANYINNNNTFYTQPVNTAGPGETGGAPDIYPATSDTGGTVNTEPRVTGGGGSSGGGSPVSAASGGTSNQTTGTTGGSPNAGAKSGCKIVTPGTLIADQLKFNLQSGQRTLISADEINEIISALFSQLAIQALQGVGGLLGTSQSSGGSPSYLDQIGDELYDDELGTQNGALIGSSISGETAFQNMWNAVVTRGRSVASSATSAGICGNNPSIVTQANAIANAAAGLVSQSLSNVAQLEDIEQRYNEAADPDELQEIADEFSTLVRSGVLNTPVTNIKAEQDADDDLDRLDDLAQQIEQCPPPDPNDPNAIQSVNSSNLSSSELLYGYSFFRNESEGEVWESSSSGGLTNASVTSFQDKLSDRNRSCSSLIAEALETARTERLEEGYVFFKDEEGIYRMFRNSVERKEDGVEMNLDALTEARRLGTKVHTMHTHPLGGALEREYLPQGTTPSGVDLFNMCRLGVPGVVLNGDGLRVWTYAPSGTSCNGDLSSNKLTLIEGAIANSLARVVPAHRSNYINQTKNNIAAENEMTGTQKQRLTTFVESLRNIDAAGLNSIGANKLSSVGVKQTEQNIEQFCSDKKPGFST